MYKFIILLIMIALITFIGYSYLYNENFNGMPFFERKYINETNDFNYKIVPENSYNTNIIFAESGNYINGETNIIDSNITNYIRSFKGQKVDSKNPIDNFIKLINGSSYKFSLIDSKNIDNIWDISIFESTQNYIKFLQIELLSNLGELITTIKSIKFPSNSKLTFSPINSIIKNPIEDSTGFFQIKNSYGLQNPYPDDSIDILS